MTQNADYVRVECGHTPTDFDYHEWVALREVEYRDRIGRRGARTYAWVVVRCNNLECNGRALVREQHLADIVAAHIDGSERAS